VVKSLGDLHSEETGTVIEIQGGQGLANRLNSLGIIPGKKVTKKGSMMLRGPVTVQINRSLIAIGYGMAQKIIVETK
jgi:ferrous iron transport protein A